MSQPAKVILSVVLGLVGVWVAYSLLVFLVSSILKLLIPVAILGGIGYAVYALVWKNNSLPGGRRYLP